MLPEPSIWLCKSHPWSPLAQAEFARLDFPHGCSGWVHRGLIQSAIWWKPKFKFLYTASRFYGLKVPEFPNLWSSVSALLLIDLGGK